MGLGIYAFTSIPFVSLTLDKYLPNGQSGIVTFGVKGGYDSAKTEIVTVSPWP